MRRNSNGLRPAMNAGPINFTINRYIPTDIVLRSGSFIRGYPSTRGSEKYEDVKFKLTFYYFLLKFNIFFSHKSNSIKNIPNESRFKVRCIRGGTLLELKNSHSS